MRRRSLGVFLTIIAAVGVGGCASTRTKSAPSAGSPITAQPMRVIAVSEVDAAHIRVTAEVPAPTSKCVRHLTGRVTDSDRRTVWVQLTFASPASDVGVCTGRAHASTTVAVPPLRGRQLSVDGEAPWDLARGKSEFRHCTGPFACSPPPRNHCDPAWLTLAAHTGELAPERSWKTLGCDQRWLVMDIDATVTGCQAVDGADVPAGCRARHVRWFLEFQPDRGWVVVAAGGLAGCASVHRQIPAFPTVLCRALPAAG